MLSLDDLARLDNTRAVVWGEVVKMCERQLIVLAVSGAKDHFTDRVGPDGKPWRVLAHKRPNGGDKPLQDSGLLKASLSAEVTAGQLRLKASRAGADVQQFGATIRAKGKKLSIPVSKEAKRAGGAKNFPRKLFPLTGPKATVLAERTGKRVKKLVVHYVLKDEVTIPARPFVGFSAATLQRISTLLAVAYEEHLTATLEGQRAAHFKANPIIGNRSI